MRGPNRKMAFQATCSRTSRGTFLTHYPVHITPLSNDLLITFYLPENQFQTLLQYKRPFMVWFLSTWQPQSQMHVFSLSCPLILPDLVQLCLLPGMLFYLTIQKTYTHPLRSIQGSPSLRGFILSLTSCLYSLLQEDLLCMSYHHYLFPYFSLYQMGS